MRTVESDRMNENMLPQRTLRNTDLKVTSLGFGSFKLGRNMGIKYPDSYDLPTDQEAERILNKVLDLGITLIDTAPAYGLAEERIGKYLEHRRDEFVISTKVGETFMGGVSSYDFTSHSIRSSMENSLRMLQREVLDIVFIHSDGNDLHILHETEAVAVLKRHQEKGDIRAIGFSGKTVAGAEAALSWADVLMVEYHLKDRSHEDVIKKASEQGTSVFIKKGLASGHLSPKESIEFVLQNEHVTSLVTGGLNLSHLEDNINSALAVL